MSLEGITGGLEKKWKDTEYKIVLEKMTLAKSWPDNQWNIMIQKLWER